MTATTALTPNWQARLAALPPEPEELPRHDDGRERVVVVVLDDDPTGTQAVSGVPVLTRWTEDDLRWAFRQDAPAVFVSLNTRAMGAEEARTRVIAAAGGALGAAAAENRTPVFASRGDSTLRGWFPLETDAVQEALIAAGRPAADGVVLVPAFLDGGRVTIDSVHLMLGPDGPVPVGETEFAQDRTFGYRSSDLRDWVEEKSAGRWRAGDVARITIGDIRGDGIDVVTDILADLAGGRPVVVDAVSAVDLVVVAEAVRRAERRGRTLLYRVGPSFVRARAGLDAATVLGSRDLGEIRRRTAVSASGAEAGHGLVVVGSHVEMTTAQLGRLRDLGEVTFVEVDVAALLDPSSRASALSAAVSAASAALDHSELVLHTSRALLYGPDAAASLAIARSVAAALVELVRRIVAVRTPRWVIAKGGIT